MFLFSRQYDDTVVIMLSRLVIVGIRPPHPMIKTPLLNQEFALVHILRTEFYFFIN